MCVKLTIEIRARQGKFQELYQTMQALLPVIREAKNCLECRIYRGMEGDDVFFMSIHWKSRTDLEHYIRSESGSALLGAIDLLAEAAKVDVDRDSPLEGLDTLKRMRKKT